MRCLPLLLSTLPLGYCFVVVNQFDWELQQLDVKTVFLNRDLEETIFMDQPMGYVKAGEESKVYLLKKSLYGLKQSPR